VESVKQKVFSCLFFLDVLCCYRTTEKIGVMNRCLKCSHYFRLFRQLDEQEEDFFEEAEKIWKYGYPRKFDISKGGS